MYGFTPVGPKIQTSLMRGLAAGQVVTPCTRSALRNSVTDVVRYVSPTAGRLPSGERICQYELIALVSRVLCALSHETPFVASSAFASSRSSMTPEAYVGDCS